jgi:ABC-type nitrate/sulfonate/bicarbonate transport system ATPase subunit
MSPSGWGKTSLFRVISGWYRPGFDIAVQINANYDPATDVEFIGNHQSLLPWLKIAANASIRSESGNDETAIEAFQSVGLPRDIGQRWPYELSLGMYKRAELVCALLRNPRLLILDEFFASLDDIARMQCAELLAKFSRSNVLIISTHQIESIPFPVHRLLKLSRAPHSSTVTGFA